MIITLAVSQKKNLENENWTAHGIDIKYIVENWSLLKSSALNFCSENGLNNVGCIIIS
jgi:hypothetical protein